MSEMTLTPKRLFEGVWEAIIDGGPTVPPEVKVTHLDKIVDGVSLADGGKKGRWILRVPVPVTAICDGVQTFFG